MWVGNADIHVQETRLKVPVNEVARERTNDEKEEPVPAKEEKDWNDCSGHYLW